MSRSSLLRLSWWKARAVFYPTLCWNVLLGRWLGARRWWDRVDEHLLVGALPFRRDVPRLAAEGVRGVVNMCEEYAGPQDEYRRHGIDQLRLPTIDFTSPSLEDVQRGVDFIRAHAERGQTVYLHCKAGRARSATVAVCWLVASRGVAPEVAQQILQGKRAHVNPRIAQRPVVRQFAAGAANRSL